MSNSYHVPVEVEDGQLSSSLADRMDPAIGEATSMIGAVMTELMRRSLRGGVMKIGSELQTYVGEKVDEAIAERQPAIEQAAAEIAENTARAAATEVAKEEVLELDNRTQATTRVLSSQILETAQMTEVKSRELAAQIQEAEKRVSEAAHAKANVLVQEAEKRVSEAANAQANLLVQNLTQRSRESTERMKARIAAFEASVEMLGQRHEESRDELVKSLETNQAELRARIDSIMQTHEGLLARVVELEKPRGLRRLWRWLFARKQKAPTTTATAE